jgi:hypothetical protein
MHPTENVVASDDQESSFLGSVSKDIKAAEATASALPVSDKPVTLSLTKSASSLVKPNPLAAGAWISCLDTSLINI